ncbi:MAG TPA: sugar ABC transporter permease [Bacilli bacterium]
MIKKHYYSYSILFPGLVLFSIFIIVPSLGSFFYAFTDQNHGFRWTRFVGWENFTYIFQEEDNKLAFKNTFIFTIVTTVFKVGLGLLLALLVNRALKLSVYLRAMLFFPAILSSLAVALAFTAILHPSRGLLNESLRFVGLDSLTASWLTDPHIVMYSISMVEVWKWTGFTMALLLAGLQSIPKETLESARIDGANSWKQFRYITLPLLSPVLNTAILLNLIGGLKVFDVVYALTGGGPGNASNVMNTIIFKNFAAGRNGEANANSVVLFLIVAIIVLVTNHLLRRTEKGH